MKRKSFCSWSGGKDSCLALNRAIENGEFHTFVFDGKLFKSPVNYEIVQIYNHTPVFPSGDAASFWYAELGL